MVEQAQEHLFQPAGLLADADHRDIERPEHLRMPRQGCRQLAAGVQALPQVAHHLRKPRVLRRFFQPLQRAHDGHAGFQQRVHLPAEQQHFDMRDLLLAEAEIEAGALAARRRRGFDFQRHDAQAEQLSGHRAAVGALQHPLHGCAAAVAALVGKERHGQSVIKLAADAHRLIG